MKLSLRAKLRLPAGCSDEELQEACSRYYTIYKGVLDSAADASVKDIARAKLEDLIDDAADEGIRLQSLGDCVFSSEIARINANVEAELAKVSDSTGLSVSRQNTINAMIDKLPESAKRYYLSALVILRGKEQSIETYTEALGKLKSAAMKDPENPIYTEMIKGIEQELSRYSASLTTWREEKRRELQKEENWERFKEFLSGVGSVLLWIVGAVFTVGAAIFSCFCSVCDAC